MSNQWAALRLGSELYHQLESRDHYYNDYLRDIKKWDRWEDADQLGRSDMVPLIGFLNQWRSRYEDSSETRERLVDTIRHVLPVVTAFKGMDLLSIDLDGDIAQIASTPGEVIGRVFDAIALAQGKKHSTVASKIMHTMNPELFIMWDEKICAGYALDDRGGSDYADRFLRRMQQLARSSGESNFACGHPMAKVVDEYNYVKFTLARDEIWDAEMGTADDSLR